MLLETLLFDLDGTLINSIPLITWTFEKVFEHFRLPWNNGEVLKTIGIPLIEVAERYMPGRAGDFMEKYTLFQREKHADYIKLHPGTIEALEFVRSGGYRTGVVTSKRRVPALADMEVTGLSGYFDTAIAAEDVALAKPHPDPVLKALQLLRTSPGNALFIGDSWYDIMAGKEAGVTTVGVTWGMACREELLAKEADFIIDAWGELEGVVKKISAG